MAEPNNNEQWFLQLPEWKQTIVRSMIEDYITLGLPQNRAFSIVRDLIETPSDELRARLSRKD